MLKTEHYKRYIPNFSLDKVVVGDFYDEEMQRKIHRFKFVHNHVDIVYFKSLFSQMEAEYPYIPDVIIYPPISLRDRIFRWPNHAKILVDYCNDKHITTLSPFHKNIFSSHQSRRNKDERTMIRNEYSLKEAFKQWFKDKKVLLLDDIITTGYTAHTLWKLLKKAGASEVVGYFLSSEKI